VREFGETLPAEINAIIENTDMPVKIFSYDETRPGLITSPGRRITLPGIRPVARIQRVSENYRI
jgi:hypothetical protein